MLKGDSSSSIRSAGLLAALKNSPPTEAVLPVVVLEGFRSSVERSEAEFACLLETEGTAIPAPGKALFLFWILTMPATMNVPKATTIIEYTKASQVKDEFLHHKGAKLVKLLLFFLCANLAIMQMQSFLVISASTVRS